MVSEDEKWMRRCIQLAKNGKTGAPPNPMVGAVIVWNGRIIGEGYHARCGSAHAEVNAITSVVRPERLRVSTIYVSLEPCSHYGKTPPCSELIIRSGIRRVVVGCIDPFSKVEGRGVAMLREEGIEVIVGVCEQECLALNKRFVTFHSLHRPFVTLKWAQSADGYLDIRRSSGAPAALSTPHTLMRVHRLRAEHQAILVGRQTALLDNPTLNVRHWCGQSPLRIVMDRHGTLPRHLHLFDGTIPTLIAGKKGFHDTVENLEVFTPPDESASDFFPSLMDELFKRGIQSLLVEGGGILLQSIIDSDLWDEAHYETSPKQLGSGVEAPTIKKYSSSQKERFFGASISHYFR